MFYLFLSPKATAIFISRLAVCFFLILSFTLVAFVLGLATSVFITSLGLIKSAETVLGLSPSSLSV